MVRLALASALSDRAAESRVLVIDDWAWSEPKTKDAIAALGALGIDGRALVVLTRDDEIAWKSFRNLQDVHIITTGELNAYDVLAADWIIFTRASLPGAPAAEDANDASEDAR
jgi:large subunit ribosomal protein L4